MPRTNPYEQETPQQRSDRISAIKLNGDYDEVLGSSWRLEGQGRTAHAEALLVEQGLTPPVALSGRLSEHDQARVAASTVAFTFRETFTRTVDTAAEGDAVAAIELGAGLFEKHGDKLTGPIRDHMVGFNSLSNAINMDRRVRKLGR